MKNDCLECRICLDKIVESNSINIYSTKLIGNTIADWFQNLFDLNVYEDDQMPKFICEKCKLGIELSINLRNEATESNEILVQRLKEKSETESSMKVYEEINQDDNESEAEDAVSFLLQNIESETEDSQLVEISINDQHAEVIGLKINNTDDKRKFQCNVCLKRFLKRTNLLDHLKIHAGIKSFVCNICSKSFIQLGNLQAHIRVHTKIKPFACSVCPKKYTQSSALKIHMRSHTQERNYICDICSKGFTNSSDLGKHKKIHLQEKDYQCMVCQQQFTQKIHAKKHIKKVHLDYEFDENLILKKK